MKWYGHVTRPDGLTKSDTTGNGRRQSNKRQAETGLDSQHHGVDRQILRRYSSHGTQPAGVERPDGEDHHDSPLRLSADLRDKARQGKARQGIPRLYCLLGNLNVSLLARNV